MAATLRQHRPRTELRLLIVSDERDDAAISSAAIDHGPPIKQLRVSSLAQARDAVDEGHVHAVLVDNGVVRTMGHDVCRQITSARRIPVIMLLDDDAVVEPKEAIVLGADGFYYKRQLCSVIGG